MTHAECLQLFALLAAAYPKEPMTKPQVELYATLLAPYAVTAVRDAALTHVQKSPWFPRVSDLVGQLEVGTTRDPDQGWAEVLRQVRCEGWCGTPQWSGPAVAEAVQALGWQEICASDNQEATRAHFLRFYERSRQRQQDTRLRERLDQALPGLGSGLGQIGLGPRLVRKEETP